MKYIVTCEKNDEVFAMLPKGTELIPDFCQCENEDDRELYKDFVGAMLPSWADMLNLFKKADDEYHCPSIIFGVDLELSTADSVVYYWDWY